MGQRVSQVALESLEQPSDGAARVSQLTLESLEQPSDGAARVSQLLIERLETLNKSKARLSMVAIEVLMPSFHRQVFPAPCFPAIWLSGFGRKNGTQIH